MTPFFSTPERIAAVDAAAAAWVGTPFAPNSSARGPHGGVCCHFLAAAVLCDAGFPIDFSVPTGPMRWGAVQSSSIIEPHMDGLVDRFFPVSWQEEPQPGDVLGFRINSCIHHLGVALTGRRMVHVLRNARTVILPIESPAFKTRLARIWRPAQ